MFYCLKNVSLGKQVENVRKTDLKHLFSCWVFNVSCSCPVLVLLGLGRTVLMFLGQPHHSCHAVLEALTTCSSQSEPVLPSTKLSVHICSIALQSRFLCFSLWVDRAASVGSELLLSVTSC